jgi:Predicted ATPase related to phosphate starvation-inducible protein PhoH
MIWPATGYSAGDLVQALSNVNNISQPITAGAHGATDVIEKYLRWANDASRALGQVLRKTDLDRLVLTPRYWATLANPSPTPAVVGAVNQEAMDRAQDIDKAWRQAQALMSHWFLPQYEGHLIVPDTNVFVHHKVNREYAEIDTIDWRRMVPARTFDEVRVVVPILIVDELEKLKDRRGQNGLDGRARFAVRTLFNWFEQNLDSWHVLKQRSATSGGVTIELLAEPRGHVRLPRMDDELVEVAVSLRYLQPLTTHFVSRDRGAVLRAKRAGIQGHLLEDD